MKRPIRRKHHLHCVRGADPLQLLLLLPSLLLCLLAIISSRGGGGGVSSVSAFVVARSNPVLLHRNYCSQHPNTMRDTSEDEHIDPYMYVDKSIKAILAAERSDTGSTASSLQMLVDGSTLCLNYDTISTLMGTTADELMSLDDLVLLASQCEDAIFCPDHTCSNIEKENGAHIQSKLQPNVNDVLPTHFTNLLQIVTNDQQEPWEVDSQILIATLISFNLLESTIRGVCDKKAGKAPLLKHMIEKIAAMDEAAGDDARGGGASDDNEQSVRLFCILASTLRTLLLPSGINLRNLLWHGFLATIPRKWLALCIVLAHSLEEIDRKVHGIHSPGVAARSDTVDCSGLECVRELSRYDGTKAMLQHGRELMDTEGDIDALLESSSSFVPPTHHNLLRVALCRYARQYPTCFAAIVSLIIEHSLRLLWCEVNAKPDDKVARRGYDRYYVTLDGHGQRDKHDIVLLPYLSSDNDGDSKQQEENLLVQRLGGSILSFLSDLFTSPYGPNVRSAVTHGIWDSFLYQELEEMASSSVTEVMSSDLDNVTYALLASIHLIAGAEGRATFPARIEKAVRPAFSYAALMTREIELVLQQLVDLSDIINANELVSLSSASMSAQYNKAFSLLSAAHLDISRLIAMKGRIVPAYNYVSTSLWTASDVFKEHHFNIYLSECRAACILIKDLSQALSKYLGAMSDTMDTLNIGGASRRCKQAARLQSVAPLAVQLYKVATFAALLHIEGKMAEAQTDQRDDKIDGDVLLKAVERSRMCISTFSTLLDTNIDRSIKAAANYASGKAIKSILSVS